MQLCFTSLRQLLQLRFPWSKGYSSTMQPIFSLSYFYTVSQATFQSNILWCHFCLSRLFLLHPVYPLADYCIMKNKNIKFTCISWFILNSQSLLLCFSFYCTLRLFKLPDLICHRLKSLCGWMTQDTNHLPHIAGGQRSSWTTSHARGDSLQSYVEHHLSWWDDQVILSPTQKHLQLHVFQDSAYPGPFFVGGLSHYQPSSTASPGSLTFLQWTYVETFNLYKMSNPSHKTQQKIKYYKDSAED